MQRKLTQLNPTLAAEIELWATTLRDGRPMTVQRDPANAAGDQVDPRCEHELKRAA